MSIAHFLSSADAEIVQVSFVKPQGGEVAFDLLVDSGFTGHCGFVLPSTSGGLAHSAASTIDVGGALSGLQKTILVSGRISSLSFQSFAVAILADTASLGLLPGVDGVAGLQFLRQFQRWGSEKLEDGSCRFFLETKDV